MNADRTSIPEGDHPRVGGIAWVRPPFGIMATGVAAAALMVWLASHVTIPVPPSLSRPGTGRTQVVALKMDEVGHPPELVLAGAEAAAPRGVVGERLRLLDPAPLFLPLRVGAGLSGGREPRLAESTGTVGAVFPAILRYNEAADLRALLRPSAISNPVEVASILLEPRWFEGLARDGSPDGGLKSADSTAVSSRPVAAIERAFQVRVFRVSDKAPQAVVDWGAPGDIAVELWKPLKLMVLINSSSRWTTPSIISGSGIDEVDEKIRWIVGRDLLPTLGLWPGLYRFEVGP